MPRGWFREPRRHALAAKGVKTGRKRPLTKPPSIPSMVLLRDFNVLGARERYAEYLGARFSSPVLKIDDNTIRFKWVKRKTKKDLVAPGYTMTVEYDPGWDLYDVKTQVFDGEGNIIREATFSQIYGETLIYHPDVLFEGWEKKERRWFYERPI